MSDAQRAKRLVGFCATHLPGSQPVIKSGGWDGTVRGGDAPGDECRARARGGDAMQNCAYGVVRDEHQRGLACLGKGVLRTGGAPEMHVSRRAPRGALRAGMQSQNSHIWDTLYETEHQRAALRAVDKGVLQQECGRDRQRARLPQDRRH